MQLKNVIDDMKKLGFSEYEVKAYMSLLKEYPLNGYGLSKISGIPRSRIYEVLGNLEEKQIVFKQIEGEATVYYPLEPQLLVDKLKKDLNAIIEHVESYTHQLYDNRKEDRRMISIKGYDDIINFVDLLIGQAKERIALSIWEEEADLIKESIIEAGKRGVSIKGIYFGAHAPVDTLVYHRRINRYLIEKRERHINITIDGEQVVSGVISRGPDSSVSWIKDPGFVEMSEDYISHDVMINAYSQKIEGQMKADFEEFSDEARRDYFEYTHDEFEKWKYQED